MCGYIRREEAAGTASGLVPSCARGGIANFCPEPRRRLQGSPESDFLEAWIVVGFFHVAVCINWEFLFVGVLIMRAP